MIENSVYFDFAKSVRNKVNNEVNGLVKFEIFESIDTIIFKIYFKEFHFEYGVNDIQSLVYDGKSDEIAKDILDKYKKAMLNAFFKTDSRKRRDENKRLGIKVKEGVWEH